jgi:hypothetical protein
MGLLAFVLTFSSSQGERSRVNVVIRGEEPLALWVSSKIRKPIATPVPGTTLFIRGQIMKTRAEHLTFHVPTRVDFLTSLPKLNRL